MRPRVPNEGLVQPGDVKRGCAKCLACLIVGVGFRGAKITQWLIWHKSGGVRVRFRVRFQAVKVPLSGGFPVENPTNKATASKLFLMGISLSEYGSEGF